MPATRLIVLVLLALVATPAARPASASAATAAAPATVSAAITAPAAQAARPAAASAAMPAPAAWRTPVADTVVARGFDLGSNPFEGGRHRGVDLAAPAGAPVRAPCGGRVVVAGTVGTSGGVVTIRCGAWRASLMPLAAIAVEPGAEVRAGARLGTAAPSPGHRGIHLGVRRDGDRFGYVDPLGFLAAGPRHPPPAIGGRRPRIRTAPPARRGPAPRPATEPARQPATVPARQPAISPAAEPTPARPDGPHAEPKLARPDAPHALSSQAAHDGRAAPSVPWPAWPGAALLLAAAIAGLVRRARIPRNAAPRGAPAPPAPATARR